MDAMSEETGVRVREPGGWRPGGWRPGSRRLGSRRLGSRRWAVRSGIAALVMGLALVAGGPAGAQEPDPGDDPGATTSTSTSSTTDTTVVDDGGPIEPTGPAASCEEYNPDATPEGEETPPSGPCDGGCTESVTDDGQEVVVCADSATPESTTDPTTTVAPESVVTESAGTGGSGLPETGAPAAATAAIGAGLVAAGAALRRRGARRA